MMKKLEKPALKLKLELEIPDFDGAPPRKFAVSRALKARWLENPDDVTSSILNEIKNYKGSFLGDIVYSLFSLVKADGGPIKQESSRNMDVTRWAANMIDSLVFLSVKEGMHNELVDNTEIPEWDGTSRKIEEISSDEINEVNIEKLLTLLSPKLKHALFLISKDMKK